MSRKQQKGWAFVGALVEIKEPLRERRESVEREKRREVKKKRKRKSKERVFHRGPDHEKPQREGSQKGFWQMTLTSLARKQRGRERT